MPRTIAATVAAALPALIWIYLTVTAPAQYRLIVADSVERGWPIAWSTAVLLLGAICSCLLLWRHRLLSPLTALGAVSPAVAALISFLMLAGFSAIILVGVLIALALPLGVLLAQRTARPEPPETVRKYAGLAAVATILATFLGFAIASGVSPIAMPRSVGALTIASLFLACAGALACGAVLHPRTGAVVVAWWLFAGLVMAPNNHEVRTRPAAAEPRDVVVALREWLANRRDLDAYRKAGMPYPVIFVSSEGGGIYAAAHAHAVLSTLAARCPTFSQHVLVAVGVSGGAVGNVLFQASSDPVQKAASPCTAGPVHLNQSPLTADHLSPVLARFLLVETIDSFLPGRWTERDRGGILVDSFRASVADPRGLGVAVAQSFDPRSARPAVAAVTTDIGTGGRLVLSPIVASSSTAGWWPAGSWPGARDTDVLEAAGISARFPWVTPTARLTVSDQRSHVLADGGYFENSGAETVLDLIRELRAAEAVELADLEAGNERSEPICRIHVERDLGARADWKGCAIHIFPIHLAITTTDIGGEGDSAPAQVSQSFLLDPLATLISTRSSRGALALKRADEEQCGTTGAFCVHHPEAKSAFFKSYMSPVELGLPLGWFIRREEASAIARHSVPLHIFGYRGRAGPVDSDLEHLILHLDPALWNPRTKPGIDEYRGQS